MVHLIPRIHRALLLVGALLSPIAIADDTAPLAAPAVSGEYLTKLLRYRDNVDFRFRDRILSPLSEEDRASFAGLNYYDAQPDLVLPAEFQAATDHLTFAMPTFNRKTLSYSHYGTLTAAVAGRVIRLKAFRREENDGSPDLLLVPFRDPTSQTETYPGGRYIEISLPLRDRPLLDFNRAMNPLCAYDAGYACPIPPKENHLTVPIRAGEKRYR